MRQVTATCVSLPQQLYLSLCLTGVNIWTLSEKLPMNVMMDMRWLSLSMRLNCIIKRSSSLRASRGFLSLSYCRSSFTSASVGRKRMRHSTKSTRTVRRSNLEMGTRAFSLDLTQGTGIHPGACTHLSDELIWWILKSLVTNPTVPAPVHHLNLDVDTDLNLRQTHLNLAAWFDPSLTWIWIFGALTEKST